MIEVINQNNGFKASMGTEIKSNNVNLNVQGTIIERHLETIEKPDTDFRDFIQGKISMDELFKKKEGENEKEKD